MEWIMTQCSIDATGRYLVQPPFLFSKWKDKCMKNRLKASVCALLNSKGGKFKLKIDDGEVKGFIDNKADQFIRSTEQYLQTFLDPFTISNNLRICDRTSSEITCEVEAVASLCTLEYNIYLPTECQVLPIKTGEIVKKILNVRRLLDVTETEAIVPTKFVHGCSIDVMESKTVRFKLLKAEMSKPKGHDFGDRIITHAFTHYVSAFANSQGGRIYYGVNDDGIVEGTKITEKDKQDLTKKLSKYLNSADQQDQADTTTANKMQWPDNIIPQKGVHWDISFVPVEDDDGKEIPSTYVIVIFVAACPGGVFAKEPESYYISEEEVNCNRVGRVKRMTMAEWKMRLLSSTQKELAICRMNFRRDWSSFKEKLICDALDGNLLRLINLGKWDAFKRVADEQDQLNRARGETADVQIDMVLLSKWFMYHYRKDEFDKAEDLLKKFEVLVPKSKDDQIFKVRGRLISSEMERTRGDHKQSYEIAKEILSDVAGISACILTAEFYVHFASMLTIIEANKELNDELKNDLRESASFKEEAIKFYDVALQHLREAEYVPGSKADMEQKTYINLAILKLGCSLSGDVVDHRVSVEDIEAASTSLERVDNLITKKRYALSGFRKCHHLFALSSLFYRQSQLETTSDRSIEFLESAIEYAEDANRLAKRHDFQELLRYSEKHSLVHKKELERKISEKRKNLKRQISTNAAELIML